MKIIVHPGTGTIVNADECLIVELEKLSDDDHRVLLSAIYYEHDDEVVALAQRVGYSAE